MTSTTHPHESTAPALSVAIELGAKEWLLTMSVAPGERHGAVRYHLQHLALERGRRLPQHGDLTARLAQRRVVRRHPLLHAGRLALGQPCDQI